MLEIATAGYPNESLVTRYAAKDTTIRLRRDAVVVDMKTSSVSAFTG